jgi:hypothetical protein
MLTTINPQADYSRSFSEELTPFDRLGASRPPVVVAFLKNQYLRLSRNLMSSSMRQSRMEERVMEPADPNGD